ncbi:MAG: bifunctional riboflavin kinase/FAD synthetase [Steroidobacteraceae bacterium]|jgi:riboflavin kinase/FMN adenylyltransferase
MELIRRLTGARAQRYESIVTIGTFDGLHVGHQALIARVLEHSAATGLKAALVSFEPMPREYLQRATPPARLTNFRERWRLLESLGLDTFCQLPFNARLRAQSGAEFLGSLVAWGARRVIIGHDFRFGHGGQADAEWCLGQAKALGIAVEVIAPVLLDGQRASSGLVREALAQSEFGRAAQLLGRPYTMCGRVLRGRELGRTLGFPTANLALRRRRAALAGIFAVRIQGPGLTDWPGVASLGTRPTVDGVEPLLEAHLFDWAGNLYGAELEIEFVGKLRDEQKFDSLPLLVAQMHQDAAQARALLKVQGA